MNYGEFPEIEIPAFLSGDGWHDNSWHNDVCPRSHFYLTDNLEQDYIVVWVAEEKPEEREYPECPRYLVQIILRDEDFCQGAGYVARTDSSDEVIAVVAYARATFATGGHDALAAWTIEQTKALAR